MLNKIAKYAKALVAVLGAVATILSVHGFPADGHIVAEAASLITALLVYLVPNAAAKPVVKVAE
jgi:hypothetical protein